MLVNDALLRIANGDLKRLKVEMPPRHGKSQMVSEYASGWFVGRFGWPVILASYEADFASSWGGKSRNHMREYGREVFGTTIGPRDQEKWWECSNGGQMMTAGVGGPITGKGFKLGIIDDPVKNAEQADSDVYRQTTKDWYDSTWRTRREPDAAEIIVMTRWHEDDLGGYVETLGETWETIRLPAIAEYGDQLGRAAGEALCADRYPIDALNEIKSTTPPRWWSALYQQHPVAEEGALFKRDYWQRFKILPQTAIRGCITVDTAGWQRGDSSGDRCVLACWMTDGVRFYCIDVQSGHWEFPEVTRRAKDMKAQYNVPVVVEDVPWSKPLIQTLQKEVGCIAWPVAGKGSKENRARAVVHHAEAMLCFLPETGAWVGDFIEEHAAFPNGQHDDQVDTTTMALMYLSRGGQTTRPSFGQPLSRYGGVVKT